MEAVQFSNSVFFPDLEDLSGTGAAVHLKSLNIIFNIMYRSTREAGEQYTNTELDNATLGVSGHLAAVIKQFLDEEAYYTDAGMQQLKDGMEKSCESIAQTFFLPFVSISEMKEISGGVSNAVLDDPDTGDGAEGGKGTGGDGGSEADSDIAEDDADGDEGDDGDKFGNFYGVWT